MRLEVRHKRGLAWSFIAGFAALIGLFAYLHASGAWPLFASLFFGVPLCFLLWLSATIVLQSNPVLVVDADGVEDRAMGARLRWSEIAAIRVEVWHESGRTHDLVVTAHDPDLATARARRRNPIARRLYRPPFDINIDDANVTVGEVVAHVERWWGRRVPYEHRSFRKQGTTRPSAWRPSSRPADLRPAPRREPPLAVGPDRRYWARYAAAFTFFAVGGTAVGIWCLADGDYGRAAIILAGATWIGLDEARKTLKLALRRRPFFLVDSLGIQDPLDPIPLRWVDIAAIRHSTYVVERKPQHELLIELHDFDGWLRHWDANWEPGMTKTRPEHPLRLTFSAPLSVPTAEILDRIEREWGRPFVREEDLLPASGEAAA